MAEDLVQKVVTQLTADPLLLGTSSFLLLFVIYLMYRVLGHKQIVADANSRIELLKKSFEAHEDAIMILSDTFEVLYANAVMIKLLGLSAETYPNQKLLSMPKLKIKKEWIYLDHLASDTQKKAKETIFSFPQTELKLDANKMIPINLTITKASKNRSEWGYIVNMHDLRKEIELREGEHKHKITHLPNQTIAHEDLSALYAKTHLSNEKLAIMIFNIDNFAKLMSLLGHEQTNKIMIKLAEYFTSLSKEYSFKVYHTYQNHFLLVMTQIKTQQEILDLVQKIQEELKGFYNVKDVYLRLTASVGIGIYPDSGNTRSLLDNAYKALADAEAHGHGNVVIHIPEKKRFKFDELTLYNEMPNALEKGEFEVYYQPIIKSQTLKIVGAEALIRWIHPVHGLIPPDAFIPIMEKTGFIVELGKYMVEQIFRQIKRWEQFNFKRIYISINVSMVEIETETYVDFIVKNLKHYQVDPEQVTFEVTEGVAMVGEQHTIKEFKRLRDLGCGVSLDDFGTGYTSFSYLKKFPASTLKIDKSLADHILTKEDDRKIIQAMIDLAHHLEMKVVVEGIENKGMVELLKGFNCDLFQGYYFSKPLPMFEFQKFLR